VQTTQVLTGADCTTPPCVSEWSCSLFSTVCVNGQQTRTCNDLKNCWDPTNQPSLTQSCNCQTNWSCTTFSACGANGLHTRTCRDLNSCGTTAGKPAESESCTYVCPESWTCNDYPSSCINGIKTRTCSDTNRCGTTASKPVTTQACTCTPSWSCGLWGATCVSGQQTRTCTDANNCGTTTNRPETARSCPPLPAPVLTCIDSDGGVNPDVTGTVTIKSDTSPGVVDFYMDQCGNTIASNITGTFSTIKEYYCINNSTAGFYSLRCGNNCSGGRCQ
jgi:hypothetical protein